MLDLLSNVSFYSLFSDTHMYFSYSNINNKNLKV